MYKIYCRLYQRVFWLASYVLPWRLPALTQGKGSLKLLPKLIHENSIQTILIVTDGVINSLGLMDGLLEGLKAQGISYAVYDKTVPNPTVENVEQAVAMYKQNGCEALIAFGGGSPMDCAKAVGARIARPRKQIAQMRGIMKVHFKIPPLFAVPTTAGTGSETTLASVIKNSNTHEKYALMAFQLIPRFAVLDPQLTAGLPPFVTAITGMDALVHAVEAYIGKGNSRQTRAYAIESVKLVFGNLQKAFKHGDDMQARENMLKAAFYGGAAFTRAYVGYIHAVGHQLSGFYSTPHGLVNAVIAPYVLESYGKAAVKPLAALADAAGVGGMSSDEAKAKAFIAAFRQMNVDMGIPEKIEGIDENDISVMVKRALKEANPLYPVPVIWGKDELTDIYHKIMK